MELTVKVWQDALRKHWKSLNLENGNGLNLVVEHNKVFTKLMKQGFTINEENEAWNIVMGIVK